MFRQATRPAATSIAATDVFSALHRVLNEVTKEDSHQTNLALVDRGTGVEGVFIIL